MRILVVFAGCILAACATTQSPERQRRIADCLADCKGTERPQRTGPFDQNAGRPDPPPNACEQRCEAMK
jgi:hypothetical protein